MVNPLAVLRRVPLTLPALDVLIGGVLVVSAVIDSVGDDLVHPWTELFAGFAMASIVLRTRAPLAMAAIAAVSFAAYAAMPDTSTPMWSFIGILVVGFSVGANLEDRRRGVALGVLIVSTYVVQIATTSRMPAEEISWAEVYLTPPVIVLAPALAGWLLQRSRQQTVEVRRLAAELVAARERHAEAAATAERRWIARELHDVISHAVSVMVVQAGAAEQLLAADDPARGPVHAVRDAGREALAELRRQLGLLRERESSPDAPMPGLADIPRLVDSMDAELSVVGDLGTVGSPGLELAAFRVVQEALTNARRHANGGPVAVRIVRRSGELELSVDDSGGGSEPEVAGTGNGLIGLHERVALYGGRLEVGPRGDGAGWRVRARLPVVRES